MADSPQDYYWMVVAGGIACFTMGFGIGANDVANNFGSSIGSGAIKFGWAILLAAIFEFVGAVGFGSSVTDAVRSGVIDPDIFADQPASLMFANFAALIGSTIWLLFCSARGLPVSTTHSVIGSLFGVGLAIGDPAAINWSYMLEVVISWVTSPVLSLILAGILFIGLRAVVLRNDNALKRMKIALWPINFALMTVFTLFFIFKNPLTKEFAKDKAKAFGVGVAISTGITIMSTNAFLWLGTKRVKKMEAAEAHAVGGVLSSLEDSSDVENSLNELSKGSSVSTVVSVSISDISKEISNEISISQKSVECGDRIKKKWYEMPWYLDLHKTALDGDLHAQSIHDKSEQFNPKLEEFFKALQVLSAIVSCIVHGSNDVANATAPYSTIYSVYQNNGFDETVATPVWILALGGGAIAFGVALFGHRVIQSIGIKLVRLTPSRGFCVELGMASIVVIGSMLGLPLSTTHCQVGATIGVGLMDKHEGTIPTRKNCKGFCNTKAVNGRLIRRIIVSWVATLIFTAAVGACLFAFANYSPRYIQDFVPETTLAP